MTQTQFFAEAVTCPVCRTKFTSLHIRSNTLRPKEQHSDFHIEYYGASPNHYLVQVCPNCFYASYRPDFAKVYGHTRKLLQEDEETRKMQFGHYDFSGLRSPEIVQTSYELALHCYQLRKTKRIGLQASLYLHMAWLAREENQPEQERRYLESALEKYSQAFAHDVGNLPKDEIKQTYLLGDLSLQLGQPAEAVRWFQTGLRHSAIKEYPGLARRIRARWEDARHQTE